MKELSDEEHQELVRKGIETARDYIMEKASEDVRNLAMAINLQGDLCGIRGLTEFRSAIESLVLATDAAIARCRFR